MEKASKKISEVEILLTSGIKKTLATLTKEDFPKIKLDDDKGFNLKRGVVSDDGKNYVERRFFKRANNDAFVFGDLTIPLTEIEFNKLTFADRLNNYVKGKRVDWDSDQLNGGGKSIEEKIIDKAIKLGMPQKQIDDMRALLNKKK